MLSDSFKFMSGLEFYLYFVSELIPWIPTSKRKDGVLILDEFGSAPNVQTKLRHVLDVHHIPREFRRIHIRLSKSEPLIQIAGLIAGAVLRRDAKGDSEAYEIIERRIRRVMEFG